MKKVFIYVGLTIVLIVAGFLTGQRFLHVSMSELNLNNVSISWTTLSGQFKQNLIYAIAVGLIPFLQFITNIISKSYSFKQHVSILGIIVISGIVFWQFRIYQLNKMFEKFADFNLQEEIKNSYYAENLRFGLYLGIGLIIGATISSLIFKQINKRKIEE